MYVSGVSDSDLAKFRAVSFLKLLYFTKRDYQGNSTFKWSLFSFSFFFARRKQSLFPEHQPLKILPCCNDLGKKKKKKTCSEELLDHCCQMLKNWCSISHYCRKILTKFEEKSDWKKFKMRFSISQNILHLPLYIHYSIQNRHFRNRHFRTILENT